VLIGRSEEQRVLVGVLRSLHAGGSAAIVVTGEAGIGKTALLDWLAETAGDVQVIRATGVQQETEFSFGGLHQILRPLLPHLRSLPAPQRQALQVALAVEDGPPPDRFLVYLSALTLITSAALDRPLLFVVDDVQWLDQQSREALAFAARRVLADPVALVFGLRAEEVSTDFDGLPVLELHGLSPESANELLLSIVSAHRHLDYAVAGQIVTEAGGNPLAIEELAAELIDGSLTAAPLTPLPLTSRLESRFLRLVRALPAGPQTLLLVAACEPTGEPRVVLDAARQLGVLDEAADVVQAARLITLVPQVAFRHPLVRSAVYGGASPAGRRRAHMALAHAWDGPEGGDLRAWHRGAAATGPDETVASELVASAGRARSRGGYVTEASFLSRAADLTPDAAARGERLLAAAEAAGAAGSAGWSRALLTRAQAVIGDGPLRPYGQWLRGLVMVEDGHFARGTAELSAAAEALRAADPEQARLIFLDAMAAGAIGCREGEPLLPRMGRAALAAKPAAGSPVTMADLLLEGIATRLACGYEQAAPVLARAIRTWQPITSPSAVLWFILGHLAALDLWDFSALREWDRLGEQYARSAGLPQILRTVLLGKISVAVLAGRLAEADSLSAESQELGTIIGAPEYFAALSFIEIYAIQGRVAQALAAAEALDKAAQAIGFDGGLRAARFSLIRLSLGQSDYQQAVSLGLDLVQRPSFGTTALVPPDLVEAAVRTGRRELAERTAGLVSARARVSAAPWGRGLDARCQALIAPDQAAEEHYQESIRLLGAAGARLDEMRSVLLYGEWLRRQNRRADARVQLRLAFEAFTAMGARAFAERARAELAATGQRLPKAPARDARDSPVLTAQETRIVELAVQGDTKAEMAAKLYISANTVDYHLRHIYQKFGVQSRRELTRTYQSLRVSGR